MDDIRVYPCAGCKDYYILDLVSLKCRRRRRNKAMEIWAAKTGYPESRYSMRKERVFRDGIPVDYPLFSVGDYNGNMVVLLKEFGKCIVLWNKAGVGMMLGDKCLHPGRRIIVSKSNLACIWRNDGRYTMKFELYWAGMVYNSGKFTVFATQDGADCGNPGTGFRLMTVFEVVECCGWKGGLIGASDIS